MKVLIVMLALAVTHTASAQTTLPVADGARVRVSAPHLPAQLYGRALVRNPNTTTFTLTTPDEDARVSAALSAMQRIQVSRGRARIRYTVAGAGLGFLLGGVIGGQTGGGESDPEGWGAMLGTIAGATAGLTVGAIAGFAYAPERWRTVYTGSATDTAFTVVVREGARIKRLENGVVAVRGERNRKAGILRGALVLGGIALVFGGVDLAQSNISAGDFMSGVAGNAIVGGAVGYLVAPRGWQLLPASQ